jgi:hypothetical protein
MRRKLECQTVGVRSKAKKLRSVVFYNLYSSRKGQLADEMAIGEKRNRVSYDHQVGRKLLCDKDSITLSVLKLM